MIYQPTQLTFGKYDGWHINQIEDLQYLRWLTTIRRNWKHDRLNQIKQRIKQIEYYGK